MRENGRILLRESQTAALKLQKEKLEDTQRFFNDQLDRMKTAWAELFTVIRKEVGITKEEAGNWKINADMTAFNYVAPQQEGKDREE